MGTVTNREPLRGVLRYSRYSIEDLVLLGLFWVQLGAIDLRLRILPYRLNRRLLEPRPATSRSSLHPAARRRIERLTRLVSVAARRHHRSERACLRSALVLRRRLRARGVPATLVYGAKRARSGDILLHAWLSTGGVAFDPVATADSFTPLSTLSTLSRRRGAP